MDINPPKTSFMWKTQITFNYVLKVSLAMCCAVFIFLLYNKEAAIAGHPLVSLIGFLIGVIQFASIGISLLWDMRGKP